MVENEGIISSAGGYGIKVIGSSAGPSALLVINTGLISGALGSFLGDAYANSVINAGTMVGDLRFGLGDDRYDGLGGTVQGHIFGSAANDLYRVSDASAQIVELADEGRDRIEASVSFDLGATLNIEKLTLLGDQALTATGNAQDNLIIGNTGANFIIGADGYDRLDGRQGGDVLAGGAAEVQLFGGSGNDALTGGDGDDRLTGGGGADHLSGGGGADVFIFGAAHDSQGSPDADTISDFTTGFDRINLAGLDADPRAAGDQALVYIGAAPFTAAGQVRYDAGLLEVDLDGDCFADMQIILATAPVLVANDLSP